MIYRRRDDDYLSNDLPNPSQEQESPLFDVLKGFQCSMENQLGQMSEHLKSIDDRISTLEVKYDSLESLLSEKSVETPTRQLFKRSKVTPPNLQVISF